MRGETIMSKAKSVQMILLALAFLLFCPTRHFRHFTIHGSKPYCMVKYQTKEIECIYDSMDDCQDDLKEYEANLCYPNKFTK